MIEEGPQGRQLCCLHLVLFLPDAAAQKGFDVFNALDLMENKTFLEKLKFGIGDGNLQYYLYNWKCPSMGAEKVRAGRAPWAGSWRLPCRRASGQGSSIRGALPLEARPTGSVSPSSCCCDGGRGHRPWSHRKQGACHQPLCPPGEPPHLTRLGLRPPS